MFSKKNAFWALLITVISLFSCAKNETATDSDKPSEISDISLTNNQVIYDKINISATFAKSEVPGSSVEVFVDNESIYLATEQASISFTVDPLDYSTGSHKLMVTFNKMDGTSTEKEVEFSVQRKLITINLPENIINQYIINAVVFASKMDGSFLAVEKFNNDDRTITLKTEAAFEADEEFMLTFALTDNGTATGLLTYANLTLDNPKSLNLKTPMRYTNGTTKTYSITGFDTTDSFMTNSGYQFFDRLYGVYLDTANDKVDLTLNEGIDESVPPSSAYYLYGNRNNGFYADYAYLHLNAPLDDTFILDKADFITDGVETKNLTINTSQNLAGQPANLHIYGYLSAEDKNPNMNRASLIYNKNQSYSPTTPFQYSLNTNLPYYLHNLTYGNFYTQRLGPPSDTYTIPEINIDYTLVDKTIQLNITGTGHDLGRVQLMDYENTTSPVYVWNFTFNSNTTSEIVIPELPSEVAILQDLYMKNKFKVGSVELANYEGISDFSEYLQKVVKNQEDHLLISTGYDVISKSDNPFFNRPIKDYVFQ